MIQVGTVLLEALGSLRCAGWGSGGGGAWSAFIPGSEESRCLSMHSKSQGAGRQGASQNRLWRDIYSPWLRET